MWNFILITHLEKESRTKPPMATQTLPLPFLLLKQMGPIVGSFCAVLNASMVTLTEINAFNLPPWYSWDTIRQPVGSSWPYKLLPDELHSGCLYIDFIGLWLSQGRSRVGPAFSDPCPTLHRWPQAEKNEKTWRIGWDKQKRHIFPSFQAFHTVFSHTALTPVKKSLPFTAKFPIYRMN